MVPVRPSLLIQIGYQQTRVVGCKRSVISAEVKTVVLDMLDGIYDFVDKFVRHARNYTFRFRESALQRR